MKQQALLLPFEEGIKHSHALPLRLVELLQQFPLVFQNHRANLLRLKKTALLVAN